MIRKTSKFNLLINLYILLKYSASLQELRPTVRINQGIVVGVKVYLPRVTVNAFLGIPYAEPPVGALRFAVPQPHKGWPGTRFASNYGPLCPYYVSNSDMSDQEDCLYLNVWTTANSNNSMAQPVMVYLSSDPVQIPGHNLAAEGVVLVSVNYRQNIFGSLCFGGPEARGNLGLLDQYMALIWIRDNIDKFGGDKNSITLIGHGAAATSVINHITSPRARGLFSKGVIMSGNSFSPWNNLNPIEITQKIRSDLGCMTETIQSALECLRSKSVPELLNAFGRSNKDNTYSILPVVDTFLTENDRYLPTDTYESLNNGSFIQIPLVIGTSDFINGHWEQQDKNFMQLKYYIEENFINKLIQLYKFDGPNKNFIKTTIIWKYFGPLGNDDLPGLKNKIHDLQRDSTILAPSDRLLTTFIKTTRFPVYSYFLQMSHLTKNISDLTNVGSELLLLFGPQLLKPYARRRFTFTEEHLSYLFKQSLVAFAKKSNPSMSEYEEQWQPYNSVYRHVRQFGDESNLTEYRSIISFWNELLPKVSNMLSQTNSMPQEYQISPDPAASFRQAMYTLVGLVVALLILLLICIVLLKRKFKERKGHFGTYN